METKKEIIFIVMGVFLISLVCAASPPNNGEIPPLPNQFMGNVILYGEEASAGTEIKIYVGGNLEDVYNITEKGKYDLYVKTGNSGDDINFMINGKSAGNWTRTNGETIILNLTISNTPVPPVNSPPASSSGGGGGGGGGGTPSVVKNLSSDLATNDTNLIQESENNKSETESIKKDTPSAGFLTGAVIGTADFMQSKAGVLVFIIFLGMGVILIKFKLLKKWTKKI